MAERWNRRAERTCEMLPLAAGAMERSACGAVLEGATVGSYCEECGARVVDE